MTPNPQKSTKGAKAIGKLVAEALQILAALGVPLVGLTERRKEKMAKAFLALADVKPGVLWNASKDNNGQHRLRSRQIIAFMNANLGERVADSSYDDIRREDLVLPEKALIVLKSAKDSNANTNDGTRGFALSPLAAKAIRAFGTNQWESEVKHFMQGRESLAKTLQRDRDLARIPIKVSGDVVLQFSSGNHNALQKEIIETFLPLFGYGCEVLYVGDTAKKNMFLNQAGLESLNFFELAHDKLPDVVAYSKSKSWLFLIEAVTTSNPVNELRRHTLLELTQKCTVDIVFVTAFPDRATYRKFAADIAWETEVWIADAPKHMIHFNGDKFLGPHK